MASIIHPHDAFIRRLCSHLNIDGETYEDIKNLNVFYFDFSPKDGFLAKTKGYGKRWSFHKNPVTTLNTCCACGKIGIPRRIQHRSNVLWWHLERQELKYGYPKDYSVPDMSMLCMSCWNKARSIVKKQQEQKLFEREIKSLTRSITDAKRDNH